MGIGFTNMKEFEIVSLSDSALKDVPIPVMKKYELSRDINDLPQSIWMSSDLPIIFKIRPLSVDWESVAMTATLDSIAIRTLVRQHVTAVMLGKTTRHPDFSWDRGKLDDESLQKIPFHIASEIAGVIIQAQSRVPGGDCPFSPSSQPQYAQDRDLLRLRKRLVAVVDALGGETASDADLK